MSVRSLSVLAGAASVLALGGCMSMPSMRTAEAPAERVRPAQQARPAPLEPVPAGRVAQAPLPPPGEAGASPTDPALAQTGATGTGLEAAAAALDRAPGDPAAASASGGASASEAASAPAAPAVQVGRTDLIGGWKLASGGESCQLTMVMTTWTGGYRASTRGCSSPALKNVSAWNLNGSQVTLMDDSGATVARLYPSSKSQFEGQTGGGQAVSVSR